MTQREKIEEILVRAFDKGYEKSIQVVGLADEHYIAHQETMVAEAIAQIETLITEGKIEIVKKVNSQQVCTGWAGTHSTYQSSFDAESELKTLQASLKGKSNE